jgi:hypothetical protein
MAQLKIWDGTSSSWVPAVVGARGDTGADSTVVGPRGVQGETGPAVDTSTLSVEQAQVAGLVAGLAGKAGLTGNTFTVGQVINSGSATTVGAVIRGAAGQTANLQEWQSSTGNVLANINFAGALNISDVRASGVVATYGIRDLSGSGSYIDMTSNPVAIRTRSATNKGLTVIGAAGQTANLQEWQSSTGGVVASVDPNGNIRSSQLLNIATFSNSRLQMTNTGALFDTQIATNVPLAVRGAAGQTANLQEWQDSSGTAVAKVDATGKLTAANFLQGTGSPLGVVSANPGAIYVDTASTMGASQWQKMSGTGTTGWVVTVGDTGWRAVGVTQVWRDAVIGAGMTLSDDNANGIILRRINQRVEIYYGINKSVAGGAVASGLIPDGWRPGASTGYIGTNSSLERLRFYVPSYGSPGSFGSQVGLAVSMPLSYLTSNAWPTSLPGTAA